MQIQTPQQIAATSPALTKISTQPPPFLYPPVWGGKVPLKVKMAIDAKPDLPFSKFDKKENTIATKNNEYYVWVNSYGAVSAIFDDGTKLGLKPYEFEVIEWHNKN